MHLLNSAGHGLVAYAGDARPHVRSRLCALSFEGGRSRARAAFYRCTGDSVTSCLACSAARDHSGRRHAAAPAVSTLDGPDASESRVVERPARGKAAACVLSARPRGRLRMALAARARSRRRARVRRRQHVAAEACGRRRPQPARQPGRCQRACAPPLGVLPCIPGPSFVAHALAYCTDIPWHPFHGCSLHLCCKAGARDNERGCPDGHLAVCHPRWRATQPRAAWHGRHAGNERIADLRAMPRRAHPLGRPRAAAGNAGSAASRPAPHADGERGDQCPC